MGSVSPWTLTADLGAVPSSLAPMDQDMELMAPRTRGPLAQLAPDVGQPPGLPSPFLSSVRCSAVWDPRRRASQAFPPCAALACRLLTQRVPDSVGLSGPGFCVTSSSCLKPQIW